MMKKKLWAKNIYRQLPVDKYLLILCNFSLFRANPSPPHRNVNSFTLRLTRLYTMKKKKTRIEKFITKSSKIKNNDEMK
jgi:hypothetical protein